MRIRIAILYFFMGTFLMFAQRNTNYGQYPYKMLPVGLSFYTLDGNFGLRLSIENSFHNKEKEWVEKIDTYKTLRQVIGILSISGISSPEYSGEDAELQYSAAYQMGWRKSFSNTLKIEALGGYQYLRRLTWDDMEFKEDHHLVDVTVGFGQDYKMKRESFLTWYIRPGLNYELESSGLSFYSPSLTIGIDYRFENIYFKRWKNPWFKEKDKGPKAKEFQRPDLNIDHENETKEMRKAREKREKEALKKKKEHLRQKKKRSRKNKKRRGSSKYETGKF